MAEYKFINYTNETKVTRKGGLLKSGKRQFIFIKPKEEVILPEQQGERIGLTKKALITKDGKEATKDSLEYPYNLTQVNGVGKKLAEDLSEQFPNEEELKKALEQGEDFGLQEKTHNNLKEFYNIE